MKCGIPIKRTNGGTNGINSHVVSCTGNNERPRRANQTSLTFAKMLKIKASKGLAADAKLVCGDNIPVYKVVNSAVLREMFKILYDITLSRLAIGKAIDNDHHLASQNVKSMKPNREKAQLLCISLDKWTSADWSKFIGVYLYCGESLCLGMIPCKSVCGAEDICTSIKNHLKLF